MGYRLASRAGIELVGESGLPDLLTPLLRAERFPDTGIGRGGLVETLGD